MARGKGRRWAPDVAWFLPGKRRPFAHSTMASSDLIAALAADPDTATPRTWEQIANAILFDPEAKAIAQAYVDAGHGDELPRLGRVVDVLADGAATSSGHAI